MIRHAYLILAHNEPNLLKLLVEALDDPRNDIYIHFDGRVEDLPHLSTQQAGLIILKDRVKVYWADVSMIKAEYLLFKEAYTSGKEYAYFHLLSGVDLPLKTQDYIHQFFTEHNGKEFVGLHQASIPRLINQRLRCYHLFPHTFRGRGLLFSLKKSIRTLFVWLQSLRGGWINRDIDFHKGGQWVSITPSLVSYLLSKEEETLARYKGTFAADEFFIPTLIWGTPFMEKLYDPSSESYGAMRAIAWREGGVLIDYLWDDLRFLQESEFLFARKFNTRDMNFIQEILKLSHAHG